MGTPTTSLNIVNGQDLAPGGSVEFDIDLERFNLEGLFSLQIALTIGTGNVDVTYQVSNNGTDFITPTGAANLFTAHAIDSGPGADGNDIVGFNPTLCKVLRINVTEAGGANPVTFSLWMAMQ